MRIIEWIRVDFDIVNVMIISYNLNPQTIHELDSFNPFQPLTEVWEYIFATDVGTHMIGINLLSRSE
jgi:hypothetical protein